MLHTPVYNQRTSFLKACMWFLQVGRMGEDRCSKIEWQAGPPTAMANSSGVGSSPSSPNRHSRLRCSHVLPGAMSAEDSETRSSCRAAMRVRCARALQDSTLGFEVSCQR